MRISDPLIGSQLGDYQIIDLLGRGGMARVYRGFDARLDRYAAVKVIDTPLSAEDEEEYQQRFQREARSIARLNHPCIVGVYQFGQVDSLYYMAMAFVEGRDLGQLLRECAQQRRRMPYADIVRIIGDIAAALDHAHMGGVIHRDIKPSNIMVKADGHAVLTDFGLALNVPEGSIGNTFGSAHYIAPEQAVSSAQAVPQSDLYSLGVVLYQMLTGKVPFDDPSAMSIALKHMHEPPPPPSRHFPELPRAVEAVVLRALEKVPTDRYPTGKAMTAALTDALKSVRGTASLRAANGTSGDTVADVPTSLSTLAVPSTASTKPPTAPVPQRRSRRWWLIVVTGSALAFVAALLFAILPKGRPLVSPTLTPPMTEEVDGVSVLPTRASVVAVAASSTATASPTVPDIPPPTLYATDPPSLTPTATVTDTPTPTPSATLTERPTNTATPSATVSPTSTVTLSPTPVIIALEPTNAADSPIGLFYDASTLVLINRSNRVVDLSGIEFSQRLPDGTELTFQADLWRGAGSLLPSNCFQVWTNGFTLLPQPLHCVERQGWRAVSYVRLFWASERPGATFEVRRAGRLLATCRIDALTCGFDPGERQFP